MHGWTVADWTGFAAALVVILGAFQKLFEKLNNIRVTVDGKMTELMQLTRQLAIAEGREQMRLASEDAQTVARAAQLVAAQAVAAAAVTAKAAETETQNKAAESVAAAAVAAAQAAAEAATAAAAATAAVAAAAAAAVAAVHPGTGDTGMNVAVESITAKKIIAENLEAGPKQKEES